MQRTPDRCPCCSQPLGISWDMWGQYYVCQGCGFTAEDDDELKPLAASEPIQPPMFLTTRANPYEVWQTTHRR